MNRLCLTGAVVCVLCLAPVVSVSASGGVTPRATVRTLTNGMRIVVLKNSEAPLIRMRAIVRAGARFDPAGRSGLAAVTCDALLSGAGKRDAVALQRHIDSIGARITTKTGRENSVVDMAVLSREALSALRLMSDLLFSPQFTKSGVSSVAQRRRSQVFQSYDLGYPLMDDLAYEALYPGQSFSRPPQGTPEELSAISAEDVREFHHNYYYPGRISLVITGDFDERRLMTEAATVFLPEPKRKDEKVSTEHPEPVSPQELNIVLLDEPGQPSSRIGFYSLIDTTESTGRRAAEKMLAHLLAGDEELSFLGRSLSRQRRLITKLSGGARFTRSGGMMSVSMSCARENVVDVIDETLAQFRLLSETRISKRELEEGKRYFRGNYALGFETAEMANARIAEVIGAGERYNYHDRLLEAMSELTQGDIKTAAAESFSPGRLVVVVYGDAERYERQLSAYGSVTRRRIPSSGE